MKDLKNKKNAKKEIPQPAVPLVSDAINAKPQAIADEAYNNENIFEAKFVWHHDFKTRTIDLTAPIEDNLSDIYKTNLNEMIELAGRHNIKVILIQQPDCLYHFSNNKEKFNAEDKKAIMHYIPHAGLSQDWINTTNALYPQGYKIMEGFRVKDNIVGVYDINDVFDDYGDKRLYWQESCHQTPLGREAIGKHIANIIQKEKAKLDLN